MMPMSVEAWKPKERGRTRPRIVDSPGLVIIPVPPRPVIAPKEEGQTHVFVYRVSKHVTLDTRPRPNNNNHARKKTSGEVQQKKPLQDHILRRERKIISAKAIQESLGEIDLHPPRDKLRSMRFTFERASPRGAFFCCHQTADKHEKGRREEEEGPEGTGNREPAPTSALGRIDGWMRTGQETVFC